MSIFKKKKETKKELEVQKFTSNVKIGLALSGGGTRGLAYLGVFKALEENGIKFDYVAGTSVGSLMGAVYASRMPVEEMIERAHQVSVKDILTNKIKFMPSKTEKFIELIDDILGNSTFETLDIPLTVVATDVISGKELRITKGNLATAIAGSCAVPAIFKPVDFEKYRLYDGGLVNNIPADAVREMGADIVISFDMNPDRGYGTESTKYFEELKAALRILMKSNSINGYIYSDLVVKLDLNKFNRAKLDGLDEMIEQGYLQTLEQMPQILKVLGQNQADENIKKVAKRLKSMQKIREKYNKKQQKLVKEGIIFDTNLKRKEIKNILLTGDDDL